MSMLIVSAGILVVRPLDQRIGPMLWMCAYPR